MNEKPEALKIADAMLLQIEENIALRRENERLREALVRHGKHTADCCDMYRGCVCGLDEALRREET